MRSKECINDALKELVDILEAHGIKNPNQLIQSEVYKMIDAIAKKSVQDKFDLFTAKELIQVWEAAMLRCPLPPPPKQHCEEPFTVKKTKKKK